MKLCHWCEKNEVLDKDFLHCVKCNWKRLGNGAGGINDKCPVCKTVAKQITENVK